MKIGAIQNYQKYNFFPNAQNNSVTPVKSGIDCFESSCVKNTGSVSFGSLFSFLLRKIEKTDSDFYSEENQNAPQFAKDISSGIKALMDKEIPPVNFKSIMTPDEFREILPNITQENFTFNEKHLTSNNPDKSKIYCIDLDNPTNYSGGKDNVFDMLDKAAKYADIYYKKTGKEFVFAVTDRDTLEGVQHAVRIVGENPEKFKHLKLIPSIKLSFAHEAPNSQLKYENSEMLVYGINPFSINLVNYVETNIAKRKTMILNFIKQVNNLYPEFSYDVIEFAKQNGLKYKRNYTVSNLYWRAREYSETKGDATIKGISKVPEDIVKEAEDILENMGKLNLGSDTESSYQSGSGIITNAELNKSIKEVFEEYSTHLDETQGKVVSSAENLYSEMINCLSLENDKPTLAISAPYYLSHYYEKRDSQTYDKVLDFLYDLKEHSNGMLCAIETLAPSYDLDRRLSSETIKKFNDYLRQNSDFYQVGGSFAKIPASFLERN